MNDLAITIPAELPVAERADELMAVIAAHQVVIVAGETGSGKSTQLPKLCLALGRGQGTLIGHTQPRRVAARTIAERIADELGTALGDVVGYTVRFTDRAGPDTRVRVMTDGILLAEIQRDRLLSRYDTLIIDEAHERSLNVDLLLGYLHQLLPRRPDLKVIITSATIDTERFAAHFAADGEPAPVVVVSGRAHPVEVRYRPFGDGERDVGPRDQVQAIAAAVDELVATGPGDILVFLSGEREIHDTAEALRRAERPGVEVLPLYARLSAPEQHRIFQPHRGRRIVLATNVAETSITVPGVRYVIDTGTARISRYSVRLKVQRLPIEPVSQASANQRAGRCGRLGPGVCIRLYSEDDLAARPEFTEPEIQRTNLASVILQMTAVGLGDVEAFPFLDPPDARAVRDGIALLRELGALADGLPLRLTSTGRRLARLPVDPRLGRMVVEAQRLGCVREVLVIAAALSIQDPRERPADRRQAADELHRRFDGSGSDFLAFVELFDHLRAAQRALSGAAFRRLCTTEFLHYLRVREWRDLYSQLRQVAGESGIRGGADAGHPDRVHQAALAGLLSHIGVVDDPRPSGAGERRRGGREYRGARDARFVVVPGSAVRRGDRGLPAWVMAAELVETDRLRARVVAAIQPEWAERAGGHLVKRSYGEPRWDSRRGAAVCQERVTLYGLPVADRVVGYERIDPLEARRLFVHHALVLGEWEGRGAHRVLADNDAVVDELRRLGERTRRTTVDEDVVHGAYERLVPSDVVSAATFNRWLKRHPGDAPKLAADTLVGGAVPSAEDYPGVWVQGDLRLAVSYRFDPGDPADGATVHIPIEALNAVDDAAFEWHVPGFREERVAALLQSLPKAVRRDLAPMGETTQLVAAQLAARPPEGRFDEAVAAAVRATCHAVVDPRALDAARLPAHLQLNISVEGAGGEVLAVGKDLGALRSALGGKVRAAVAAAAPSIERHGLTEWPAHLPAVVETHRDGLPVRGYPALVDDGDSVSLRVFTTPELQARVMHGGVRRLLLLGAAPSRRVVERSIGNAVRLALGRLDIGFDGFVDDLLLAAADDVLADHPPVTDGERFAALRAPARAQIAQRAAAVAAAAGRAVVVAADVAGRLERLAAPSLVDAAADMRAQLDRLVRPGFVTRAGSHRLADITRYVRALGSRLDKLGEDVGRDRRRMAEVVAVERRYAQLLATYGRRPVPAAVAELGWTLEELRVAVFAQSLGAARGASLQRVSRTLDELTATAG